MRMRGTLGRVGAPGDRPEHRGPVDGWPEAGYDAVLHLLDRQVVDSEGMLVGKVDDLEIVEDPDGTLVPTAILMGPPAFLPRFGDRMGQWLTARYVQTAVAHAERSRPGAIEFDLVDEVRSGVHLRTRRDGIVHRRVEDERAGPGPRPVRRSLGRLLRMRVDLPPRPGTPARGTLRVLDARIARDDDRPAHQRVAALIVGHGRPGSLLGYERSTARGPWLVAAVVRRLHRHARLVGLGPDVDIDWDAGLVSVGAGAEIAGFDA
jgi:sporulation protein YlmC with PRC-barrel domain